MRRLFLLLLCIVAISPNAVAAPLLFRNVRIFDGDERVARRRPRRQGPHPRRRGKVAPAKGADRHRRRRQDAAARPHRQPHPRLRGQGADAGARLRRHDRAGDVRRSGQEPRAARKGARRRGHRRGRPALVGHPGHCPRRATAPSTAFPSRRSSRPEDAPTPSSPHRVKDGSDYLKIVLDDGKWFGKGIPTLDAATVAALVRAAHEHHLLAVVHIGSQAGRAHGARRRRRRAGAPVHRLARPPPTSPPFVAAHHAFVIPTLERAHADLRRRRPDDSLAARRRRGAATSTSATWLQLGRTFPLKLPGGELRLIALATVKALDAAGVPLLAGTDALNPAVVHGASLHRELELLVAAGLSPLNGRSPPPPSTPAARFGLPIADASRRGCAPTSCSSTAIPRPTSGDARHRRRVEARRRRRPRRYRAKDREARAPTPTQERAAPATARLGAPARSPTSTTARWPTKFGAGFIAVDRRHARRHVDRRSQGRARRRRVAASRRSPSPARPGATAASPGPA